MAASIDGLRERWERMNPREQRLVMALSATLVVCIIAAMVAKIQSGMADIEAKNSESRKALRSLAVYRNAKARAAGTGSEVTVPDKPVALDSYLEGIISELELTSPTYPALKEDAVGEYVELSFEVALKGLDILQMTELLEKVETGSRLVVIKEINIDTNFRDKEKLDLKVKVATYKKASEGKDKEDKSEDEDS
jgi:type II secretory pathway component PulM